MKAKVLLLGVAAIAACAVASMARNSSSTPGASAPAFTASDSNGKSLSLSEYKGKYVVLEWSNFGCPFVKKHYGSGNMQALQKKYTDNCVIWLTIFSSSQGGPGYYSNDKLNSLYTSKKMASTAVIPDSSGTIGKAYGATNTPDMVVINPEGKIIYSGAIDNQATPDPDSINGATNYVANALDEAMAGKDVTVKTSKPYGCGIHYAN
jgi:hypothetical protein